MSFHTNSSFKGFEKKPFVVIAIIKIEMSVPKNIRRVSRLTPIFSFIFWVKFGVSSCFPLTLSIHFVINGGEIDEERRKTNMQYKRIRCRFEKRDFTTAMLSNEWTKLQIGHHH